MKRVYYFTPPGHALKILEERRLKISRFSECNDPFELAALNLQDKRMRSAHQRWRSELDKKYGLICFCQNWQNPVMWSHYAAKHTGICLGLDIDSSLLSKVKYVKERIFPNLRPENFKATLGEEEMKDILSTKFIHWSYEEEFRLFIKFEDYSLMDTLRFANFSSSIQINKVILGLESKISIEEVRKTMHSADIQIFRARMAFETFSIVPQNNSRLQN